MGGLWVRIAEVAPRHHGEHPPAPGGTVERWKRVASLCRVRGERNVREREKRGEREEKEFKDSETWVVWRLKDG